MPYVLNHDRVDEFQLIKTGLFHTFEETVHKDTGKISTTWREPSRATKKEQGTIFLLLVLQRKRKKRRRTQQIIVKS